MSAPSPPSFDTFFNDQRRRQHSGNSISDHFHGEIPPSFPSMYSSQSSSDRPFTDEPPSLSRHGSNVSLPNYGKGRAGSLAGSHMNDVGGGPIKQESIDFDPESSSTLIATAARLPNGMPLDQTGAGYGPPFHDAMFAPSPQHAYNPYEPTQQRGSQPWTVDRNDSFQHYPGTSPYYADHSSSYPGFEYPSSGMGQGAPGRTGYGADGTGQDGFREEWLAFDRSSPYPSSAFTHNRPNDGSWSHDFLGENNNMENMLPVNEQELNELERVDDVWKSDDGLYRLSNVSSPGSQHLSREPSPFEHRAVVESGLADYNPLLQEDHHDSRRADSMSRSISPHPLQYVQTADQRTGIPSSYIGKPQSPPALIIPSQPSPSPLQPIVTTTAAPGSDTAPGGIHLPSRNNSMGARVVGGGGLLPPANPALEHLTGMAGISPIGSSTDGPMIYIQPSTPISGLKDGRGIFEAAIRRAEGMGQQDQRNQSRPMQPQQGQPQDGFSVPPPATHPLSRSNSNEQYARQVDRGNNNGEQQQGRGYGADGPFSGTSGWLQSNNLSWGDNRSNGQILLAMATHPSQINEQDHDTQQGKSDFRDNIDTWRAALLSGQGLRQQGPGPTMDPRTLLENREEIATSDFFQRQQQMSQQNAAERGRLYNLDVNPMTTQSGIFRYESGEISPTSLAFYQQLGINPTATSQLDGTSSAPYSQSNFQNIPQHVWPQTALPGLQNFLTPAQPGLGPRRRSFAEGTNHPALGAGTPGYGMGFTTHSSPMGPARLRPATPGPGHRRAVKSEDLGQGTGWGIAGAGSTADFLHSITANDGTLLPPARGRSSSHSRHSSVSSARSASPALSISSQGSSYSHHSPRMDLIDDLVDPPVPHPGNRRKKVAKMKVTSMATEVASSSRRTNDGVFQCPVPGCGSTFTRHFNLKGHLRSHNDERPYKCLYDGCPKAVVGFARQHDCKRHMLLHKGLRPFECEGCGKKFARLDALTRHHKSEQGQECAIDHPLPTNPDGSSMSESQYKTYRQQQGGRGPIGGEFQREPSSSGYPSGDERSGMEEDMDIGNGSGMEEYDRL